jgi:DNA-directed RNA polymerase subunit M/transcription elongation factor TFIIS
LARALERECDFGDIPRYDHCYKRRNVYNTAVKGCSTLFGAGSCTWTDPRFKSKYKEKLRSLLFNLRNPKNPAFLDRVKSKEIGCRHLASLSPEDIFPENWASLKAKLAKKHVFSADLLDNVPDNPVHVCNDCNSRKITTYELQTLAADQSTTTYLVRQSCSHCWKIF